MQSFTTAHNLKRPGPCLPFIIQIHCGNNSLPASVLQSLFLEKTPTYTKELWPQQETIKLALEEWSDSAEYLLTVYTDHKNLEYLKTAEHQDKSDGPCSSPGLIPWSLITQVPKILKQLGFHILTHQVSSTNNIQHESSFISTNSWDIDRKMR